MVERSLDVAVWNLSWPLFAIAACGPVVGTGEGGSSSSGNPTDVSVDGNPTEHTGECVQDSDCGYGYACIDGFCEYQCHCGCGAAPPAENRFRCSEVGGYECYVDEDCGEGEICLSNFCMPDDAPPCGGIPAFDGEIQIVFEEPGAIRSLGFAAVEPGAAPALIGIADDAIFRAEGDYATTILQREGVMLDVAAGDIDGDGAIDLVTAEPDAIRVWQNTVDGFAPLGDGTLVVARQLALADTDANGWLDIVLLEDVGGVWRIRNEGAGVMSGRQTWGGAADRIATLDVEGDGASDVAFDNSGAVAMTLAGTGQQVELGSPAGTNTAVGLHGRDFDGDGIDDLVLVNQSGIVTSWVGSVLDHSAYSAAMPVGVNATAAGDLDGDGRLDLVLGNTDGTITIRFGASPLLDVGIGEPFGCESTFAVSTTPQWLAVGDYDGDGDPEIASSDGANLRVLYRL